MRRLLAIHRTIAVCGVLIFFALIWFVAVCAEWHIEVCEDCGAWNEYLSTNVIGLEVHREEIHTDLNVSWDDRLKTCGHQNTHHRIKHRYWGLVFCWCPCQNGTDRFVRQASDSPHSASY